MKILTTLTHLHGELSTDTAIPEDGHMQAMEIVADLIRKGHEIHSFNNNHWGFESPQKELEDKTEKS